MTEIDTAFAEAFESPAERAARLARASDFAQSIQQLRDALKMAAAPEMEGDLGELINEAKADSDGNYLTPALVAQILMDVLPFPDDRMPASQMGYWAAVVQYMGPDWLAQFRKVGAFMEKVDNF